MGVSAVATRRAESAFGVADVGRLIVAAVVLETQDCSADRAPNRSR